MTIRRHVICCDGTWQSRDSEHPTNVRKLAEMIAARDDHGISQIVYYDDGVGTRKGGIATTAYNVAAAAFGWGLNDKIKGAYQRLSEAFNPGDEIYLVGFSRGAYTARSLGGLIRKCGLPASARLTDEILEQAMDIYRKEDETPDTAEALRFRSAVAPHLVVNDKERAWRREYTPETAPERAHPLKIKFLGVMDTVGALGIPEGGKLDFLKFWNRKYRFHNTTASSLYENIMHIVALNERRTTFPPTLFDNLDKLNHEAGFKSGDAAAPYQEVWSPGNHGSVGGGGDIVGLSNAALLMMVEGMQRAGLAFEKASVAQAAVQVDVMAPLDNSSKKGTFSSVARLLVTHKDREGPREPWNLGDPAVERWRRDKSFRTEPVLRHVSDYLYDRFDR
ncbi:MAG: DUF2235 domain-containing protein [Micavibrio aeruginosavorus]|uniref:DUF2235 domain-containing protein n=1 Tax=Micavibrio aeruginosavorus TaxID=349221 RepID=A0A7T5UFY3_9BACT|nr:MAG: DUF2235 domain-containing protein [Micavibrio aeruginosavorus]